MKGFNKIDPKILLKVNILIILFIAGCIGQKKIKFAYTDKNYVSAINVVLDFMYDSIHMNKSEPIYIENTIKIDTLNGYTYGPKSLYFFMTFINQDKKMTGDERHLFKQLQYYATKTISHKLKDQYKGNVVFVDSLYKADSLKSDREVYIFSPLIEVSKDKILIWCVVDNNQHDPKGYSFYLIKKSDTYEIDYVRYPDFDPIYIQDYIKEAVF